MSVENARDGEGRWGDGEEKDGGRLRKTRLGCETAHAGTFG